MDSSRVHIRAMSGEPGSPESEWRQLIFVCNNIKRDFFGAPEEIKPWWADPKTMSSEEY